MWCVMHSFSTSMLMYNYVKQDLTTDDIRITAQEFATRDHNQFHAFVFITLSNSDCNCVVFGVNEGNISVTELLCFFLPSPLLSHHLAHDGSGSLSPVPRHLRKHTINEEFFKL